MAKRERYLFVCTNRRPDSHKLGSCAARGGEELHAALKARLNERGLAQLGVRACTSSCLDVCWKGPVVMVQPDHYTYGPVTLDDVDEIIDAFERGERVERLVLDTRDYTNPDQRDPQT